ncbi:hypothetical protein PoB_002380300 [Plakobranchus ocellatus]|uniref:Uncharacterized protein n=1 Tax=Plakobranchus ocellatus TaxID=259542 RepID=A0AAV3ZS79_9GAST|nr:hypothetical protein PoB_002380300 [Plakobranchus ocellatus]
MIRFTVQGFPSSFHVVWSKRRETPGAVDVAIVPPVGAECAGARPGEWPHSAERNRSKEPCNYSARTEASLTLKGRHWYNGIKGRSLCANSLEWFLLFFSLLFRLFFLLSLLLICPGNSISG